MKQPKIQQQSPYPKSHAKQSFQWFRDLSNKAKQARPGLQVILITIQIFVGLTAIAASLHTLQKNSQPQTPGVCKSNNKVEKHLRDVGQNNWSRLKHPISDLPRLDPTDQGQ
jgi:hypothetical protein